MIILFLIAIMFYTLPCQAQRLDEEGTRVLSYIQKAMNYGATTPQEKVYMHFDNTGYFENETMWFKAYVRRADNRKATDMSKVLYVELLNPSGDVLKTTKWPIDSLGQAYGDMKLDTLYGSGFYEVRAYTRYMTNWGVNALFSRVFPIFKAPKTEGSYKDLTIRTMLFKDRDPNNRDRSDSLYLKAMDDGIYTSDLRKTISVQFYPEGGDMVVGRRSRVAVMVVDDNGRPYQGDGFVQNARGDVLAHVSTDSLGRGLFDITPDSTDLTMQMHNLKKSLKAVQTFTLPKAKAEGVALTLDAVSDDMLVTLQASDRVCGRLLGYTVMNNGCITFCDTVVARPLIEIELDRARLREGVNQLTVFDGSGRILAERMFFICPKPSASDSIRLTPRTQRLKPCGDVVIDISAMPHSSLSFAAIDAASMTNGKQCNMKTWMLLSSDVKGYIANVDYYFEADDTEHRKAADLLMLTQGWRRYDWEMMTGLKTFEKVQPIEDHLYVFGKLNEYRKRNKVSNVALETFLYNQNGESLKGSTTTDKQGNYAFALPFLDGEWKMQIFTRINDKRKTFYVGIDRQFSPVPRFITPTESRILHPLAANMFVRTPADDYPEEEEFIPITRKDHVLQNVTVKAKRRYFTNDDWHYKNEAFGRQYATLYYDIDKELDRVLDFGEPEPTIFEFLCRNNASFNNPNCIELPQIADSGSLGYGSLAYNFRPIKWIVDNGDTHTRLNLENKSTRAKAYYVLGTKTNDDDTYDHLSGEEYALVTSGRGVYGDAFFPVKMHDIKSLYIVPNSTNERNNAVRIYIYTHKRFPTESQKGLRRTHFQGFNKPSTFKMEDYSILPPMADFRRTIYWNPNIRTDADGKAKVEFYKNSTCNEMYICAEGMSDDGRVLINE